LNEFRGGEWWKMWWKMRRKRRVEDNKRLAGESPGVSAWELLITSGV
jgi:hypothetical protein